MGPRLRQHLLVLLLALVCLGKAAGAQESAQPFVLGVFPRFSAAEIERMFRPLAEHLAEGLQRRVRLETARDFPSFWSGVASRRYDMVHFNQYHYVRAHALHGYDALLANEEHGKRNIAGALFTRADSGVDGLDDLRGRRILFGGGRSAMMSHIVPLDLLSAAGLRPWEYDAAFAPTPSDALLGVYFRQAAAGGGGIPVLDLPRLRKRIDADELMVLTRSPPLAHLPWAVKNELAPAMRRLLRDLMTGLSETRQGRAILHRAGLTDLHPASDGDYDPHRKIIARTLGEHY